MGVGGVIFAFAAIFCAAGVAVGLIWLLVSVFAKKTKKIPLLVCICSFVLFLVLLLIGMTFFPADNISKEDYDALIQEFEMVQSERDEWESNYEELKSEYANHLADDILKMSENDSQIEDEENSLDYSDEEQEKNDNLDSIELLTGNYVVGEDIPAGKCDIIGIESGNVSVYSQGKDYGDVMSEIIEEGETVYTNVILENGYNVEITNGGKVQLNYK